MVESDAQRVPELLCRYRKQPEPVVVLQRGAMALAQVAQTTQPACIHELEKVHQRHRPLLHIHCPVTVSTPEPEGGALSSARRDLCGGRSAMTVPTATIS